MPQRDFDVIISLQANLADGVMMKTRAPLLLISLFLLPAAAALGGDSRDGFYVRLGLGPSWFEEIKQERDASDFPFLPVRAA